MSRFAVLSQSSFLVLLGLVGTSACAPAAVATRSAFDCHEVLLVVRTPEVFRSRADVTRLFTAAAAAHVTAIAVSAKQDEDEPDLPSGRAFYASEIAPIASGYESFDVLAAAIEEGHSRGVQVIAWLPQFHDATAIERNPEWTMAAIDPGGAIIPYVGASGERFVSPASTGARAYERSIAVEIAERYEVDGIALDWVRYDGWTTGLEDATRQPYMARWGTDPAAIDFTVESETRERWRSHRAEIVASHVREVRAALDAVRPGLALGAFVLSPEWAELSQDTSLFAGAIDWAAPMAYFDDWGLPSSWVWSDIVPAVHARVGDGVEVMPTLDEDWTDAQNQEVLSGLRTQAPYVRRVSWFAYGDWDDALIRRLAALRICSTP